MSTRQIMSGKNLKNENTFGIECIARSYIEVSSKEMVSELTQNFTIRQDNLLFLGGGSNILLTGEEFDGIVIKNSIQGKEIIKENDDYARIKVGGGEDRDEFITRALHQGYEGCENLRSIPGSVGAAPIQNIGAYGVEVESLIDHIEGVDWYKGTPITFTHQDCAFGYRYSIFKGKLAGSIFITHVIFKLKKFKKESYKANLSYGKLKDLYERKLEDGSQPGPLLVAETVKEIRESKLPDRKKLGTAGSFFKNPIISKIRFQTLSMKHPHLVSFPLQSDAGKCKLSSGQLIDLAGCKGMRMDRVGTYQKHPLILVNYGGGRGSEIVELAKIIQEKVKEMFGITLQPEVNYIQ